MFLLILFLITIGLLSKYLYYKKLYREEEQAGEITRYTKISVWGNGLALLWVVMMLLFGIGCLGVEILLFISLWFVFFIMPIALYIFTGMVHFSMRKPYKAWELSEEEIRAYKISGVIFYIVTVLFIWVITFLIRVFTGEIMLM